MSEKPKNCKLFNESAFNKKSRGIYLNHTLLESRRLKKLIMNTPEEGILIAFDLYGRQVKTICKNILSGYSDEDVEEAVSQTFISLWMGISKFSPDRGSSIKSYIYGIARKTAFMVRRSCPLRGEVALDETVAWLTYSTEEIFLTDEEERIVHEVVSEMQEPARSIFIMKYFYFEKVSEIAKKLGLTYKKVENTLLREKKKLRSELERRGIER